MNEVAVVERSTSSYGHWDRFKTRFRARKHEALGEIDLCIKIERDVPDFAYEGSQIVLVIKTQQREFSLELFPRNVLD